MEHAEVGKRPKLEAAVAAFGKLLATQMGLIVAVVQPRRELSRAWEPSNSWHSPKSSFGGRSHLGFPHGNQV